nr:MAG TPA: hypothetical protein [Bacteriophage sp.]
MRSETISFQSIQMFLAVDCPILVTKIIRFSPPVLIISIFISAFLLLINSSLYFYYYVSNL